MSLYTVRVFKSLVDQPTVSWSNTYELSSGEGPWAYEDMSGIADSLVSFEETFHLDGVRFDRVVFSTYEPDSKPYNPDNLAVFPRDDVGDVVAFAMEREALDTVLWVRRQTQFGRAGRAYYRGVLIDTDVETTNGQLSLTAAGVARLAIVWTLAMTFLEPAIAYMVMAGQSLESKLYMPTQMGEKQQVLRNYQDNVHVRKVNDLIIAGVRRSQLNNKYFDKVGS